MRNIVIFNFDPSAIDYKELKGKNCASLVNAFPKNIMAITAPVYIQSAHRLGKPSSEHSIGMIVHIPDNRQRYLVFQNAGRLNDTHHFMSQQMPPCWSERKMFDLPEYK